MDTNEVDKYCVVNSVDKMVKETIPNNEEEDDEISAKLIQAFNPSNDNMVQEELQNVTNQ